MFHTMTPPIRERMQLLEQIDAADRQNGAPQLQRLRQVPPDTGRFLSILAAAAPAGAMIEIGTSGGYSTLWLALACLPTSRKITTFEVLEDKIRRARETFRHAGVESVVEIVHGDARDYLAGYDEIAFCFLDAEKDVYMDCYELVAPRLVPGGLLLADNVLSHQEALQPVVDRALSEPSLDAVVVPIGKGVLLCRKSS